MAHSNVIDLMLPYSRRRSNAIDLETTLIKSCAGPMFKDHLCLTAALNMDDVPNFLKSRNYHAALILS